MAYEKLVSHLREIATLRSCYRILGWDMETYMPRAAAQLRAGQLTLLAGLMHERHCAPQFGEWIEAAETEVAGDPVKAANVREARRVHEQATRVPRALVEERTETTTIARRVWVEARQESDFQRFRPWLEKIVDLNRREAEALGYEQELYDALLDKFEPGETARGLEALFGPLEGALVELLARIRGSGRTVDTGPLRRRFPVEGQRALARRAAEAIGFDFTRGRLDTTAHPFCSGAGPEDVRLTTRYSEDDFSEAFFSVLHEAGHGLYEQGFAPEHAGTPMAEACSYGIHESQSRLWENFVGRGGPFWEHFYPAVREFFPGVLDDVGVEDFQRAVNDVRPSFIRVEADEVTYNLHIFLRFRLERALLSGDLGVADLPGAWNEAFARTFGLEPPDDARGCLQDIHWSMGSFGYFPTYTLGNIYAAQLWARAAEELDLEADLRAGRFAPLLEWLRERIHRQGKRYAPRELVAQATGAPPDPAHLVDHLTAKYGAVYGL